MRSNSGMARQTDGRRLADRTSFRPYVFGWLADWLVGWFVGSLVRWFVGWVGGWVCGWLISRFFGRLVV